MNQDERKQRRKKDTKNAVTVCVVFLMLVILLAVGAVYAVNKIVMNNKKETSKQTELSTEFPTAEQDTQEEEPVIDEAAVQAAEFAAGMTLENKIAQLFMATPNELTGYANVTAAGETTKNAYSERPVGGLIYMSDNLKDSEQTKTMLSNMQAIAQECTGLPVFLGVDEEGGRVTRIAGNSGFDATNVGSMGDIGASGDSQNSYNAGSVIGTYLHELGFNVDFAPVADVLTNEENTVIGDRSFGTDSALVADMVMAELKGLSDAGVYGAVKHFPGHGATAEDSHEGQAVSERTLEELMAQELVPFASAIDAGARFIMVGHIAVPNVTGDDTPASLSEKMIKEVLRTQLGYNGIVITDAMNMGAVTEKYSAGEAAVQAVLAGADMILMPEDYETAYNGLLEAVKNGTITEQRIDESVIRIIKVKQEMQ